MERLNTRIRGGGTNVWIALAAIVGIFALVLSTLVVASPTASAQEDDSQPAVTTDLGTESDVDTTSDVETSTEEIEPVDSAEEAPAQEPTAGDLEGLSEPLAGVMAVNPAIKVDVTKISGVPDPGQQLEVGKPARVEGTWDATNANPKGGDSFSVGFPQQLKIPAGQSFDLVATGEHAEEVFGKCDVADNNTFTCVLNDNVNGLDEVKGSWFIQATAVERTTEETLSFNVPGGEVVVDLPGEGGIDDGATLELKKSGELQPDKASLKWTVEIPGNMLTPLDTENTGKVILSDKLPNGTKLCENRPTKLSYGRGSGKFTEIKEGVKLTASDANGTDVDVALDAKGAFKSDQTYRIEYTICSTDGQPLKKGEYKNTFFVDDENQISGEVGVEEWTPPTKPVKTGTITKDLKKINWKVKVPQSVAGSNPVTVDFKDKLDGPQKFCESPVALTVFQYKELPEWNDSKFDNKRSNVTDKFEGVSVPTTSDTELSTQLKAKEGYNLPDGYALEIKG
ncbi:Ig-like domain-containing protein [Corynebacterium flavescens]|uniref:SDR-like Ig domain-containing protein n=1 Tax=Corynebacterium flavescens TaxID=28028 RepID=A0A1L7CJC6_CORFL|nr:Ig-like domain-containing protein [Corynebacterium flavescens]APT85957.1 hypothetical protein CFLV_01245 [Corynebacterium flavescens]KAA8724892.1 hypothetical protein F4V60_01185 [Corynebacterium flavescens]GEB98330.1 hypothetical protein CFL01nite_18250 [Corynebacterium flavescens]